MSRPFDSHCHPHFAAYDEDREEVMRRAFDEGIFMIAVGTSYETSKDAVELAKKYYGKIWATVGVHPADIQLSAGENRLSVEKLAELAKLPEVVAIGESGLDYHYLKQEDDVEAVKSTQRASFLEHVRLAKEVNKPLVVHARDAYTDILPLLKSEGAGLRGVMHFFQGSPEEAKWFLDLGYYISFAGPITFAREYEEVVRYVPLDRILAETDAPYASPMPYRGKRNEPAYVKFVVQKIAEIKGLTFEGVAETTTQNVKTLFRIN
ncbi:MAG: TatD family hydrolase [Parcubacteria group bacterium]|nr:TatD family hydrolase [Parcubacteria group bacterium]